MADPLLAMRDINKRFQGVQALSAASLEVEPGRDHGAGRPERRRQVDHDQGSDRRLSARLRARSCLPARPIDFASPQAAQRGGVSTIYQEINLVPFRSVAENIFLGREHRRYGLLDWSRMNAEAADAIAALRGRDRRAPAVDGILDRDSADGRDRARGFVQGAACHHGRADLLARRARGRGSVRRDAQAARARAWRSFSSAIGSTSSIRSATGSR